MILVHIWFLWTCLESSLWCAEVGLLAAGLIFSIERLSSSLAVWGVLPFVWSPCVVHPGSVVFVGLDHRPTVHLYWAVWWVLSGWMFMCGMERSNAMHLLISNCRLCFLVTCIMVWICFPLAEMVSANYPMTHNSAGLCGLSFVSPGWRNGLKRRSWYALVEMMLGSAPESTFIVCYCPLILMVTIVLGYSLWSFVKFWWDTLLVSFTWRSTDAQTFPKCPFLLQRWHCGLCINLRVILSPCNTYKLRSVSLFVS